jgi:Domain of unknown function (DUF4249)
MRHKSIIAVVTILLLSTCIDPYVPNLHGFGTLLVVDARITDANTSNSVKLSRTFQDQNIGPSSVSGAAVIITDDAGNSTSLYGVGDGVYKTDSLGFRGMTGRSYVLHIYTPEGGVYESEPCLMRPVADIDSIYFGKDQQSGNNGTVSQDGLSIYLDTKEGAPNSYYRWDFDETWKYSIPLPKRFDFISRDNIPRVANVQDVCWKTHKSDGVIIGSVFSGQSLRIIRKPILFIATAETDRLMIEYSMLVRQYSISKNEYDFWDNIKKVNDAGGDIFASQPFSVVSNIHNIYNPNEMVLGYFQVSAVKEKRIFIPFNKIIKLHLPYYHNNDCQRMEAVPEAGMTLNDLYAMFCITSDYEFIEPLYDPETGRLIGLVFARPECTTCGSSGSLTKPGFWIDM